jgi:hypothetical protein
MIKMRATVKQKDVVILGLDRHNVEAMMQNKPIVFDGMEVGLPGIKVIIIAGETLDDLREDLRSIGVVK